MFVTTADRLVGNKPCVAATTTIPPPRVAPARDITLVRIRNSEREAINRCATARCEVENVFMAIVQETTRADRLEVTARKRRAFFFLDRDRFDPVNRVLQKEEIAHLQH